MIVTQVKRSGTRVLEQPLPEPSLEVLLKFFRSVCVFCLQGFVEMFTTAEALKAAEELRSKPAYINGTRLTGTLSEMFPGPDGSEPVLLHPL